jgi:hypothetical protein
MCFVLCAVLVVLIVLVLYCTYHADWYVSASVSFAGWRLTLATL